MRTLGIVRTPTGVLAQEADDYWGTILIPGTDPAVPPMPDGITEAMRLHGQTRLPAALWSRVLSLYRHVLAWGAQGDGPDSTTEVSVAFLRGDGRTRNRDAWRVLVPQQNVGGAYVTTNYDLPLVDIETGETVQGMPRAVADGWAHIGTSHSHGNFGAFYSGTDDRSELSQPGMHIVVGNLRPDRYETVASVVRRGTRYESVLGAEGLRDMVLADLVDANPTPDTFHPNVMGNVTRGLPPRMPVAVAAADADADALPLLSWMARGLRAARAATDDDTPKGVARIGDEAEAEIDSIVDQYPALAAFSREIGRSSLYPDEHAEVLRAMLDHIDGLPDFLDGL